MPSRAKNKRTPDSPSPLCFPYSADFAMRRPGLDRSGTPYYNNAYGTKPKVMNPKAFKADWLCSSARILGK